MRALLLVLGLAGLTAAWPKWFNEQPQGDQGKASSGQASTCPTIDDSAGILQRQSGQELVLERLEREIEKLDEQYKALVKRGRSFMRGLQGDEARLERLEGRECPRGEFSCGQGLGECVGNKHVCDEHNDCHNGRDEDEEICNSPAQAGAVFEAQMEGNDPCTIRKPVSLRVAVLTFDRGELLPSVASVRVSVIVEFYRDGNLVAEALSADGHFYYGRQALVIDPPDIKDDNRLMVALVFDTANDNFARGFIFHEATKDVCTRLNFRKVDH